jgi:protoheme IX farnesyltransferase
MARTASRPLPAGRVRPTSVLAFGGWLIAFGTSLLWWRIGYLPALLTALGAAYYVIVYTLLLKPRSAHGVVPGGLAGVFPPLIGWVATGAPLSLRLGLLVGLVFLWSPPHFWALALSRGDDYRRAGFPLISGGAGEQAARLSITLYVAALLCLSLLPYPAGLLGLPYLLGALIGGAALAMPTVNLFRDRRPQAAWRVYKISGPYLALLLAAMVLDTLISSPSVVALWEGVGP